MCIFNFICTIFSVIYRFCSMMTYFRQLALYMTVLSHVHTSNFRYPKSFVHFPSSLYSNRIEIRPESFLSSPTKTNRPLGASRLLFRAQIFLFSTRRLKRIILSQNKYCTNSKYCLRSFEGDRKSNFVRRECQH